MLRLLLAVLAIVAAGAAPAFALTLAAQQVIGPPGWVLTAAPRPPLQLSLTRNAAWIGGGVVPAETQMAVTRASSGTNLVSSSPAGFPYATFVNNQARFTPTLGLLVEAARTNQLFNSSAPATQTTGSLANGAYTLWVNGSGSATMSAGTATGCGTGVAVQGTPIAFTTTGAAGTCTVTVAGSLNAFQLELGSLATSLIVTAGATGTRSADVVTIVRPPTMSTTASLFARASPTVLGNVAAHYVIKLDDGTAANYVGWFRTAGSSGQPVTVAATAAGLNSGIAAWNAGGRGAIAYSSGDQAASFNASAVQATATAGQPSGLINFRLGQYDSSAYFNGFIENVAFWPTSRLGNSVLQDLTR